MLKKKKEKLISVIMSVYNDEKNVSSSIQSIINQSYKNFELLIMDDGSTDDTYKYIKKFSDDRIKIFRNKYNSGLTKSLNILIQNSSGEIIARQDSDDLSLPARFEKQLNFLLNNNLQICTSRAVIKNTKKIIPKYSFYMPQKFVLQYKNPFIHGTLFVYKELLKEVNFYDEEYKYAQDYRLFTKLINLGYKINTMSDVLYVLNTKNNISTIYSERQKYYFEKAKNDFLNSNLIGKK